MVELKIKTTDYLYRKVQSGGRVKVKELNSKEIKIIPVPYNISPSVSLLGADDQCISMKSNEVINKKVSSDYVYLPPIYAGAEVLIVPKKAKVWFMKPNMIYNRKTTRLDGCRLLTLGELFKGRIITVYKPIEDYLQHQQMSKKGWILADELIMKPASWYNNRCNVYLPSSYFNVKVFVDEVYGY